MKHFFLLALVVSVLSLLSSCAVTTKTTEGTSETFENTTNATSDLTSSTSPKSDDDEPKPDKVLKFVKSNFSELRLEMASGRGEHLDSLAVLMGIEDAKKLRFYRECQRQFSRLFLSKDTTPEELVYNLNKLESRL